jgi:hypothetical protein
MNRIFYDTHFRSTGIVTNIGLVKTFRICFIKLSQLANSLAFNDNSIINSSICIYSTTIKSLTIEAEKYSFLSVFFVCSVVKYSFSGRTKINMSSYLQNNILAIFYS